MLPKNCLPRPHIAKAGTFHVVLLWGLCGGWATPAPSQESTPQETTVDAAQDAALDWKPLFNGRDLKHWTVTNFGGEGEVHIEEGTLVLPGGSPLTGVTWKGKLPLPTCGYEIRLKAQRAVGNDFFCGLTFPYKQSHASLIVGGWGGGVIGISSLDGYDASENETTRYKKFATGRWYEIRLRVTDGLLEAWIDNDRILDCEIDGRQVTVRAEVQLSRPLGVCAFDTTARLKDVAWRPVPPLKDPSPQP